MLEQFGLTWDMVAVFAMMLVTLLLFISEAVRVDVVAVLVLVMLGITKILPPDQLFAGFSSSAVIALIGVMIIGAGLEKTGLMLWLARVVIKVGKGHPRSMNVLLTTVTGVLAGFVRSLGAIALFIPVVARVSMRTGYPKSRFLMPTAFCAILGGTLTMIGTGPLILLNSLLDQANLYLVGQGVSMQPFSLFAVFPVGVCLLSAGLIFFILFGRRVMPDGSEAPPKAGASSEYFQRTYQVGGHIYEVRVPQASPLAGGTLKHVESELEAGVAVLASYVDKTFQFPPLRSCVIKTNSVLALMGDEETILAFCDKFQLRIQPRLKIFSELLEPTRAGLCEAVIPPSSQLVGCDLKSIHIRRKYGVQVLSLIRGEKTWRRKKLKKVTLRAGDTLGMYCDWNRLAELEQNPDFVVVTSLYPRESTKPDKLIPALLFFVLSLALIIFGSFPVSTAFMVGAVGMIFSRVLTIDEAYDAVSWQTVFLLAGLIPLGGALQSTGAVGWVTGKLLAAWGHAPIWELEVVLAVITTFLSLLMSNVGATIFMVPLGVSLALGVGADPRLFALIVAVAASNTFIIPTHHANALIIGPGGYRVRDFVRVGVWLTVIYLIVMLCAITYVI